MGFDPFKKSKCVLCDNEAITTSGGILTCDEHDRMKYCEEETGLKYDIWEVVLRKITRQCPCGKIFVLTDDMSLKQKSKQVYCPPNEEEKKKAALSGKRARSRCENRFAQVRYRAKGNVEKAPKTGRDMG